MRVRGRMHFFSAILTFLSVASTSGLASAPRCQGLLNATFPFEEVCYDTIFNGTEGLSLRAYKGANSEASLVTYNASATITVYQEALELTTFYVISYFTGEGNAKNESLTYARTVPLVLRPPTPSHNFWASHMAIAPSHFPPGSKPPKPAYGSELLPMGDVTLAVLHATLNFSPEPSDFDALCAKTVAAVKAQLPAWKIDAASPYSPSHARFDSYEFFDGPFDIECWYAVSKV